MNGILFEYQFEPEQPHKVLSRFTDLEPSLLLDPLGALIVSQVERRITSEKSSPDGKAWKESGGQNETLEDTGALRDSIHHVVDGNSVHIGSDKVYAAIQHFGGTIVPKEASHLVFQIGNRLIFAKSVTIPAREYLGISAANAAQIERETANIISRLLH